MAKAKIAKPATKATGRKPVAPPPADAAGGAADKPAAGDPGEDAALDGLVALLPPDAVEVTPTSGLLAEARANIPDGVHRRGPWLLTVERNRLVKAHRG